MSFSFKEYVVKIMLTLVCTCFFGCCHALCQHYYHMYCRSNIIMFLLLDESRMCKVLQTIIVCLESNAIQKFNVISLNTSNVIEHLKAWYH